jgi:hypothetical protein
VGDFSPILNQLPASIIVGVGMWATRFALSIMSTAILDARAVDF